jgi:CelD/BcsL family acetyltransferase involved in cellulose biosynthesis
MNPPALRLDLIEAGHVTPELMALWDDLYRRSGTAPASASPAWLTPLMRAGPRFGVAAPVLLTAWCGQELAALFPLRLAAGSWLRTVQPLDPARRSTPALLLAPEHRNRRAALVGQIADFLVDDVHVSALRRIELRDDEPTAQALLQRLRRRGFILRCMGSAPGYLIDLPGTFEEYLGRTKTARRRRVLRQEANALARAGRVEIERCCGPAIGEGEWRRIVEIQRSSWMMRRGAAVLGDALHRELVLSLAQAGLARLSILKIGGDDAAFAFGTVEHQRFHFEWTAFKLRYTELSVGKALTAHVIAEACAEGCRIFDFGTGEAEYKRFWATRCVRVRRFAAVRGSLAGAVVSAALAPRALARVPALRRVYVRLKQGERRWRLRSAIATAAPAQA